MPSTDYVDYDLFLDEKFSAVAFANSLVQATNTPTDKDVDLDAPSKRLDYDIEEVDRVINRICGDNYEQLLSSVSNISLAEQCLEPLKKNLDHINYSYSKLEKDVVSPFDRSQDMYGAIKKLHMTTNLLRSLTWYLSIARQLALLINNHNSSDWLSVAAHNVVELRNQVKMNPGLKSLYMIRAHEKVLDDNETTIKRQCQSTFKTFNLLQDFNKLRAACVALYLLEKSSLAATVGNYLKSQVNASANQISKTLGAPLPAFESACADAGDRAQSLQTLTKALDTSADDENDESILEFIRSNLDTPNLVSTYWRDIASTLDTKVRDWAIRNPPLARMMVQNVPTMKESVKNAVASSGIEDGPELKVMVGSFNSLLR